MSASDAITGIPRTSRPDEQVSGAISALEPAPRTLVEIWERSLLRYADRPLFGTRSAGGRSWTSYREVHAAIDAFRAGLASLGIGDGDRVGIVAGNRVEWATAAYATYGLGATFVPMYEQQRPEEWEHILRDCEAKVVIGSNARVVDALVELRPRLPALAHVIAIDAQRDGVLTFAEILERGRERPLAARSPDPDSIAGFIYTSGTTGMPKGVMLSHANITSNILSGLSVFPIGSDDRSLSFLPWAHAYGQVIELHLFVAAGASVAFVTDVSKLLEELAEVRPTVLVAVPRVFNRLYSGIVSQIAGRPKPVQHLFQRGLRAGARRRRGEAISALDRVELALADRLIFSKVRARLGGRLRYALSASATLSLGVAEAIEAMGIDVYEGYGLTETSPVVSGNCPGTKMKKLGSVGKVIPGVKVVIDPSASSEPGSGEIIVYGPNVMLGYHARPEETAMVLTPDGGLRTGDLGYLDPDGFLHITGRIKEQYKLETGKYVMPSPLEETLKLSPFILNAMFYGENRPFNVAIIVLDVGSVRSWAAQKGLTLASDPTTDPRVVQLVRSEIDRLSASFRTYEKPAAFALVTEDFTIENGLLTPSLKLKRRVASARFAAGLEALYAAPPPSARGPTVPGATPTRSA